MPSGSVSWSGIKSQPGPQTTYSVSDSHRNECYLGEIWCWCSWQKTKGPFPVASHFFGSIHRQWMTVYIDNVEEWIESLGPNKGSCWSVLLDLHIGQLPGFPALPTKWDLLELLGHSQVNQGPLLSAWFILLPSSTPASVSHETSPAQVSVMGHGIHFLCHQPCDAAIPRGPISQSTVVMVPWGHITTSWDWLERVWHWAICGSRGTTDGHHPQWAKPLMVAELVLVPLQVTLDLPVANCGLILSDLFQGWLNLTQKQSLPTRTSVLLQNPKDTKITLPLTRVFHPRWDHLFLKADTFWSLTISWTSLHVCTYTVCQALARPGDTAPWSLQVIL